MKEPANKPKKYRVLKIVLCVILALIVAGGFGFALYVNDYYRGNERAIQAMEDTGIYAEDTVKVERFDGKIAFVPENPKAGFVFYPGGKVEADAYAPLLQDLAKQGILCMLCPMPFNLAVFDINAADGVQAKFPDVKDWYLGGHSLGGSMAASYLEKHAVDYQGLVLLGSYSASDLSNTDLSVLLIHGSDDQVMNAEKYKESLANLPAGEICAVGSLNDPVAYEFGSSANVTEVTLEGGNHAQFGSYGAQSGDGTATISPEQQWDETAAIIVRWISDSSK